MTDIAAKLRRASAVVATPAYVYDVDALVARFDVLKTLFGRHFGVSYAIKANPNIELLRRIRPHIVTFDASSFGEVQRALSAGMPASRITFSGPAKRAVEIERAIALGIGELVLESLTEAEKANTVAAALGRRQPVLIRINPATAAGHFGVNMAGKASQFGIDEEVLDAAIAHVRALPHLELIGFHIYSGTNSLNVKAIVDNFATFIRLFRHGAAVAGMTVRKLVFGSGFGIPYVAGEADLDIAAVAAGVMPLLDELRAEPAFANVDCALEMGRWLVGPAGWLLTSVVAAKASRGVDFRMCDAGFNNHLAACGMMGTVIRRNWPFINLTNADAEPHKYTLVGPLCTTIDVLATDIILPEVLVGDVIAVTNSGAYGLTASPTRFISHPEPAEVLIEGDTCLDVSESRLNHWPAALA